MNYDLNEIYEKNEGLLIDYDVFFKQMCDICYFSIEGECQLTELKQIISNLKDKYSESKIFLYTYAIKKNDNTIFLYSDIMWIETHMKKIEFTNIFSKYDTPNNEFRSMVPSEIFTINDDYFLTLEVDRVITNEDTIISFSDYLNNVDKNIVKLLYWD